MTKPDEETQNPETTPAPEAPDENAPVPAPEPAPQEDEPAAA